MYDDPPEVVFEARTQRRIQPTASRTVLRCPLDLGKDYRRINGCGCVRIDLETSIERQETRTLVLDAFMLCALLVVDVVAVHGRVCLEQVELRQRTKDKKELMRR